MMSKKNQMSVTGDIQIQAIMFALDFSHGTGIEQLGVNRPPKQLEIQISDFGTND